MIRMRDGIIKQYVNCKPRTRVQMVIKYIMSTSSVLVMNTELAVMYCTHILHTAQKERRKKS